MNSEGHRVPTSCVQLFRLDWDQDSEYLQHPFFSGVNVLQECSSVTLALRWDWFSLALIICSILSMKGNSSPLSCFFRFTKSEKYTSSESKCLWYLIMSHMIWTRYGNCCDNTDTSVIQVLYLVLLGLGLLTLHSDEATLFARTLPSFPSSF